MDAGGASDGSGPDAGSPDLHPAVDTAMDVPPSVPCDTTLSYPDRLACTGLYSDPATLTLDPAVKEFRPGLELWSDGSAKTRWILLPAGKKINVSNANDWLFPVGTKVWKEFRLTIAGRERRVETRLLWKKTDQQWIRAVYQWSADERETFEVTAGVTDILGTGYEIPDQLACGRCHGGKTDILLGVEAISLAQPAARGITYSELQRQGLLESDNGNEKIPASVLGLPGDEAARPAIGYLHMNCGVSCHNPNTLGTTFPSRLDIVNGRVTALVEMDLFKTAINVPSIYQPVGTKALFYRIRPGDPARSSIHHRMNRRDTQSGMSGQMPPLATHKIDAAGVALVEAWIAGMNVAKGYPAPAP
jgi:hypothetical protein